MLSELEEVTFRPRVNHNYQRNAQMRPEDALISQGHIMQINKERLKHEQKQREDQEYTFRPLILEKSK